MHIGARWERIGSPKRRRRQSGQAELFADEVVEYEDDELEDDDLEFDDEGEYEEHGEYDDEEYDEDEEDEELEEHAEDEWEDEEDSEEEGEEEDWWDEDADDYAPPEITRTLRFGVLSMAPLFLGYELALAASSPAGSARSVAEVVMSVPLEPFGHDVDIMRRLCLVVGLVLAFAFSRRQVGPHGERLLPRTLRVIAEGALGAVVLGPLLVLAAGYAEPLVGPLAGGPSMRPPSGVQEALLAMGGAAYEELVFRILLLSLAYVVIRRGLMWVGTAERSAGILAAIGAGLVSATIFAASHLAWATAWLGGGGEPFEASAFTWRICAGILLALLMVWRGVGVAAWAHAFYNLSSLLGLTDP